MKIRNYAVIPSYSFTGLFDVVSYSVEGFMRNVKSCMTIDQALNLAEELQAKLEENYEKIS